MLLMTERVGVYNYFCCYNVKPISSVNTADVISVDKYNILKEIQY